MQIPTCDQLEKKKKEDIEKSDDESTNLINKNKKQEKALSTVQNGETRLVTAVIMKNI